MNLSVTSRCSAEAMSKRALPGLAAIFCLARLASWRQAGALRPTVSATVSNGIWKISCSTKTTRSAGLSCCSTTSRASLTPSSKVTRSAGSASPFLGRRGELDLAGVVGALPAGAGRLDLVQAQAAGHHDQPAALVLDLTGPRGHQARERVLHDVLGRADVPRASGMRDQRGRDGGPGRPG
jgi:hypothetical protein